MSDDVKSRRRRYDGTGRQEEARRRRRTVLRAATELFETQGYAATSIADIARRAGVSAETIYKGFRTKAALTKEAVDVALAGDDEPVAVSDRPQARHVQAEPDPATKLRAYARDAAARVERSARLQLALREGARLDRAVADLWHTVQQERLHGMTMFATHLEAAGALRDGLAVEQARDILWACVGVELYDLLVLQRGWTLDQYADWLGGTLVASLT